MPLAGTLIKVGHMAKLFQNRSIAEHQFSQKRAFVGRDLSQKGTFSRHQIVPKPDGFMTHGLRKPNHSTCLTKFPGFNEVSFNSLVSQLHPLDDPGRGGNISSSSGYLSGP